MLSTLLIGLAASTATTTPHHVVPVEHNGRTVQASYHGDVRVAHRQVGMAASPGKMGTARCMWTANVKVERRLAGADGAAVLHPVHVGDATAFSGEHPGDCMASGKAIRTQVARHDDKVRAHVEAVAAADAPRLRAELNQAPRYAAR